MRLRARGGGGGRAVSRMTRRKDQHQKTISIIILLISAIPPIIGIIAFANGCLRPVASQLAVSSPQAESGLGNGGGLFLMSALLFFPILLVHLIVPASRQTARGDSFDGVEASSSAQ